VAGAFECFCGGEHFDGQWAVELAHLGPGQVFGGPDAPRSPAGLECRTAAEYPDRDIAWGRGQDDEVELRRRTSSRTCFIVQRPPTAPHRRVRAPAQRLVIAQYQPSAPARAERPGQAGPRAAAAADVARQG
jgi:hypothetical protein